MVIENKKTHLMSLLQRTLLLAVESNRPEEILYLMDLYSEIKQGLKLADEYDQTHDRQIYNEFLTITSKINSFLSKTSNANESITLH